MESTPGKGSTFGFSIPLPLQTPSVDAREYLADVEVILLGTREARASAHEQLEAACGSIRQADDMLQAVRMLTAPASGWIRRRVVVLTGEDALALVTGEGPLKLAELEAAHPDGLFLMAASARRPARGGHAAHGPGRPAERQARGRSQEGHAVRAARGSPRVPSVNRRSGAGNVA